MNDLLSLKGKEVILYEKSDLKKYIIDFLLKQLFSKNNYNVNSIYKNINNNFGKYFNMDKISRQLIQDFHRGIGFTYNNISISFNIEIPKKKIFDFKDILNKNNKISLKILDFVNTTLDFFLNDKNINEYIKNITENKLLMLSTIFVQQFYSNIIDKITFVNEFINQNFESITINYKTDKKKNSNIPTFNYIIEKERIILEINYLLYFMKNNNDENIINIPFKISAELNIDSNEITIKFKSIINNKNDLDMLYLFNSIYFYMEINEQYKDDQFKVEMLEYLKKIYNDNKSYKIIYNLLKNVKSKDDIIIILNIIKNKLNNRSINKIPIKRDETKQSYEKDFLLINFNEEKKSFDDNDCMSMLIKILVEQPSFIIISTQDCNPKGKEHYQHILGEKLKSNKYNILLKNTKDILRMRIYYNTNKVKFNEKEKSRFLSFLSSSKEGGDRGILKKTIIKKINNNISNKLILEENLSKSSDNSKNLNKDIFLVKKYGMKESTDKKYGNGLVFMRLEISKNNSFTKFIFINCNLSLNREYEFENIINDFKLLDYWEKEYNIFFSGSFNFTFNPVLYKNTEISKNQSPYLSKPINFIKEYTTNNSINKKKSSEKFIKSDKLSIFLENKIKNAKNSFQANETSFYLNLLSSIEKLGIHPTYKYIKDESTKQEDFYNNIIDYRNKLNNIDTNEQKSYIIKFLDTPDLLEKIKNDKNLVYEYFNIYIQLKLLEEISSRKVEYKSLNGKIHYNKAIQQNIIKTIINMKNKNFINNKIFNELCKKYNLENEKKEIQVMINFSKELNKQKKSSELQKKMNNYINNFIKNKQSFNKVKNNIEKYIEGKDIFYKLNKNCEKFMKNIIDKGLLLENENNIIRKKRDYLLQQYNKIFNTEDNKIIPYQGNRILYILSNHIITDSFDFEIYLFPDKSSYKLTTLSFKIYDKDNIISNRNSTIAVKSENNKNFFKVTFENNYKKNADTPEKNEETPTILGKNNSSNTNVIPNKIVSNRIKEIEKRKTK